MNHGPWHLSLNGDYVSWYSQEGSVCHIRIYSSAKFHCVLSYADDLCWLFSHHTDYVYVVVDLRRASGYTLSKIVGPRSLHQPSESSLPLWNTTLTITPLTILIRLLTFILARRPIITISLRFSQLWVHRHPITLTSTDIKTYVSNDRNRTMAPPKVTKSPKKGAKSAEGSKLDKNLVFLWVCFENKAGQVSKSKIHSQRSRAMQRQKNSVLHQFD